VRLERLNRQEVRCLVLKRVANDGVDGGILDGDFDQPVGLRVGCVNGQLRCRGSRLRGSPTKLGRDVIGWLGHAPQSASDGVFWHMVRVVSGLGLFVG
jgi:hypothetical protein